MTASSCTWPAAARRYLFLRDLQLFNPQCYFHLLMTRTEEILPFIYTPTVGEACQTYHELPMLTQVGVHRQGEGQLHTTGHYVAVSSHALLQGFTVASPLCGPPDRQTEAAAPMLPRPQGLYVSLRDRGNLLKKLKAWQQQDVRVAVVTDGERILG